MTDSRAAVGLDRLPWLADEPKPRAMRGAPDLLGWIVAGMIVVAGGSYWLGMSSADHDQAHAPTAGVSERSMTIPLPQPRAEAPQAQVEDQPQPEVRPVVAPPMPKITPVRNSKADSSKSAAADMATSSPKTDEKSDAAEPAKPKVDPLTPWPVRVTDGASGRLVRIGTFTTARQAKKGWWAIVRNNPALKRLPALVVPSQSLRNGKVYYRLQMGTTSQAHSEVLCQRMRMIGQSCVVIEVNNRGQEVAQ